MSVSTVLAIQEVAENQNNKHVTINEAISALESASNRRLSKSALAGDVTLTEAEFTRYFLIDVSSATTERFVFLPALVGGTNSPQRVLAVRNSGGYTLTVKSAGTGTSIDVASGTTTFLHVAGEDVTSLGSIGSGAPVTLSVYLPGLAPGSDLEVFRHIFADATTFPDNFVGSKGSAGVLATSDTAFPINKNGTQVGTLTYKTDGSILLTTIASANEVFAVGDVLTIIAPTIQDATLANIALSLKGLRT